MWWLNGRFCHSAVVCIIPENRQVCQGRPWNGRSLYPWLNWLFLVIPADVLRTWWPILRRFAYDADNRATQVKYDGSDSAKVNYRIKALYHSVCRIWAQACKLLSHISVIIRKNHNKKPSRSNFWRICRRGDGIWTCDLLVPRIRRYGEIIRNRPQVSRYALIPASHFGQFRAVLRGHS